MHIIICLQNACVSSSSFLKVWVYSHWENNLIYNLNKSMNILTSDFVNIFNIHLLARNRQSRSVNRAKNKEIMRVGFSVSEIPKTKIKCV